VGLLLWRILRPVLRILTGAGLKKITPLPFHFTQKGKTEQEQFYLEHTLTRCPMCGYKFGQLTERKGGAVYQQTSQEYVYKDTGAHAFTAHNTESAGGQFLERTCTCGTCGFSFDYKYTIKAEWVDHKKDAFGTTNGNHWIEHHVVTYTPKGAVDEIAQRIFDEHAAAKDIKKIEKT